MEGICPGIYRGHEGLPKLYRGYRVAGNLAYLAVWHRAYTPRPPKPHSPLICPNHFLQQHTTSSPTPESEKYYLNKYYTIIVPQLVPTCQTLHFHFQPASLLPASVQISSIPFFIEHDNCPHPPNRTIFLSKSQDPNLSRHPRNTTYLNLSK